MQITRGKINSAQKVLVYGPEGIGKSTFASCFPNPLFIDTEGSTKHMDVARLPKPSSWTMLLENVRYVKANPSICSSLVIDTADWAEKLCAEHVCATRLPPKGKDIINGIEDFGFGKGYTYLEEEFGRLLNSLEEIVEIGINVVMTAHAQMRKFEQPDEMGSYDRWELKLEKKTSPLVKEWADMVLFANYKTYVVNIDNQGAAKGKNKVQGGKRIMYTVHHSCWDAKNRHDLPEEVEFNYNSISHCIPAGVFGQTQTQPVAQYTPPPAQPVQPDPALSNNQPPVTPTTPATQENNHLPTTGVNPSSEPPRQESRSADLSGLPKGLTDLMQINNVTPEEIQAAVGSKGYYPKNTPIKNYDTNFISGVLIAAWPQVFQMILKFREDGLPF